MRSGTAADHVDADLSGVGGWGWPPRHLDEAEPPRDAALRLVGEVVVDLDPVRADPERLVGEQPDRPGAEPAAGVPRVQPVAHLEAAGTDPRDQAAPPTTSSPAGQDGVADTVPSSTRPACARRTAAASSSVKPSLTKDSHGARVLDRAADHAVHRVRLVGAPAAQRHAVAFQVFRGRVQCVIRAVPGAHSQRVIGGVGSPVGARQLDLDERALGESSTARSASTSAEVSPAGPSCSPARARSWRRAAARSRWPGAIARTAPC